MRHGFDKRIFNGKSLIDDIAFLLLHMPSIVRALRKGQVTRIFMEKIMTIITAVNGCIYCSWFHAHQALSSGMSELQVKGLFDLQFDSDATGFELIGLLYAQHYAETNRSPDNEMDEKLVQFYGERTAFDVLLFIRMIFFGNLAGNTWDAALSRFRGHPAEHSSAAFELLYLLLAAPVMIPLMFLVRKSSRAKGDAARTVGPKSNGDRERSSIQALKG